MAKRAAATKRKSTKKPTAKKSAAKRAPAKKSASRRAAAKKAVLRITTALATQFIKQEAARQPIRVALTQEQADAVLRAWNAGDPRKAARVTFTVQGRDLSEFVVAAYRYRGDTCCV
ncbi:MAG: hypothetical protein ACRD2T_01715 [Thermoanaerobaculia bacterium]